MGRLIASCRHMYISPENKRIHAWSKPLLVEALRNVQAVCPPRVTKQSKRELERIVNGVLHRLDDAHPLHKQMVQALADARRSLGAA